LLQVLSELPAAARRAPRLLVTGILASQVEAVEGALRAASFRPISRRSEGDWRLLSAKKAG
jgi:ribosomal protein L11 methylase PrmA